jgi:lipopolysaccharide export system protein LptA
MISRGLALAVMTAFFAVAVAPDSRAQTRTPAPRPKATPPASAPAAAPAPTKAPEPKAAAGEKAPDKGARKPGERSNSPIVIDADRMEAMKKEGLVIFTGNVVAKQDNSTQTADRMEVYLDDKGERVVRIVSTGNVKIVTENCRTGTARRAEYYDDEQRLLLIGDAKVWEDENVVTGDEIEMFLAEDRSTVRSGTRERVKSVFYPKREEAPTDGAPAGAASGKREEKRATACG